jgi:hypothetical protein
VFTNVRTQKVLTLEKWTQIAGEDRETTAYAHTKSTAYDPGNTGQHLLIDFLENIASTENIIPAFAISNQDNFRLDHFDQIAHRARVGDSYSPATAIPASQRWALTLETKSETPIPDFAIASPYLYSENQTLHINNLPPQSIIAIVDIAGNLVGKTALTGSNYSQALTKGIYIVSILSAQQQIRKKVIIY